MKWFPAMDELLLELDRRGWSRLRIAGRFNCTITDVDARLFELRNPPPPKPPTQPSIALPTKEEVEELKKNMNEAQRAFMDIAYHFNAMGEGFRVMGELMNHCLAEEELTTVMKQCAADTRKPGETIHQKNARTLLSQCIVILRPTETEKPQQQNNV